MFVDDRRGGNERTPTHADPADSTGVKPHGVGAVLKPMAQKFEQLLGVIVLVGVALEIKAENGAVLVAAAHFTERIVAMDVALQFVRRLMWVTRPAGQEGKGVSHCE